MSSPLDSSRLEVEKKIAFASAVSDMLPFAYPAGMKRTAGVFAERTKRCTGWVGDGLSQSSIGTQAINIVPCTTVTYFASRRWACHARTKPAAWLLTM